MWVFSRPRNLFQAVTKIVLVQYSHLHRGERGVLPLGHGVVTSFVLLWPPLEQKKKPLE